MYSIPRWYPANEVALHPKLLKPFGLYPSDAGTHLDQTVRTVPVYQLQLCFVLYDPLGKSLPFASINEGLDNTVAKIVPGCVRLYLKQELLGVSEWVAQINRLYYVVCPGSIVKIYVVGFKPS